MNKMMRWVLAGLWMCVVVVRLSPEVVSAMHVSRCSGHGIEVSLSVPCGDYTLPDNHHTCDSWMVIR